MVKDITNPYLSPSRAVVLVRERAKRRQGCIWAGRVSSQGSFGESKSSRTSPILKNRLDFQVVWVPLVRLLRLCLVYCARSALQCYHQRVCEFFMTPMKSSCIARLVWETARGRKGPWRLWSYGA